MWPLILRSQDEMRRAEEQSGAKMHCHDEKWWEAKLTQGSAFKLKRQLLSKHSLIYTSCVSFSAKQVSVWRAFTALGLNPSFHNCGLSFYTAK